LLLGVVQLYPWNILVCHLPLFSIFIYSFFKLSMTGWYVVKFDPFPFMFTMSILFNWPNVIVLFAQTKWGHLMSVCLIIIIDIVRIIVVIFLLYYIIIIIINSSTFAYIGMI
jgi:hypothetical protein